MVKISVIVPVYNTEKYLNRCVDSILAQTFTDFELILVDDGSTDGSGKMCDDYAGKDNRVKVFHKQNGGVASAKNLGIDNAIGEYINFIDSDDFVDENYLEVMYNANEECDMVIAGVKYISSDNLKEYAKLDYKSDYRIIKADYKQYIYDLLDKRALNYHVAKLYRRKRIYENKIYFTDFNKTGADDTVFNFDLLACSDIIKVINNCVYNYVNYRNSVSHSFNMNVWKRKVVMDKYLVDKTAEMGILDENMQRVLDKRVVLSALWSATAFAENKKIGYCKYKKFFKEISKSQRFIDAYKNTESIFENDMGVKYVSKNQALRFFIYVREIKNRIKAKIRKFIPAAILNKYRRHKEGKHNV